MKLLSHFVIISSANEGTSKDVSRRKSKTAYTFLGRIPLEVGKIAAYLYSNPAVWPFALPRMEKCKERRSSNGKLVDVGKCDADGANVNSWKPGNSNGNLTSQLFANIYLNELDQFITKTLGLQNYIRYADDFLIIGRSRLFLDNLIPIIQNFLENRLMLKLHPKKIVLRKWHQGIDFLGYVSFPHHTILRTKTKHRMIQRLRVKFNMMNAGFLERKKFMQTFQSYCGLLDHCRSLEIERKIMSQYFVQHRLPNYNYEYIISNIQ